MKQSECEDKPTSMAGCSLAERPWLYLGLSVRSGPRLLEGSELTTTFLKATSIQTNGQDSTVLPRQELLPSRNAVGCCKGE